MRHLARPLLAIVSATLLLPWSACAQPPHGASVIEPAAPGAGYDYVVHVKNHFDYKYNPLVREDRFLLARRAVRPFCKNSQIVGENKFSTEIFGIWPGVVSADLVVPAHGQAAAGASGPDGVERGDGRGDDQGRRADVR